MRCLRSICASAASRLIDLRVQISAGSRPQLRAGAATRLFKSLGCTQSQSTGIAAVPNREAMAARSHGREPMEVDQTQNDTEPRSGGSDVRLAHSIAGTATRLFEKLCCSQLRQRPADGFG